MNECYDEARGFMTTLTISLPGSLCAFVESEVAAKEYESTSDYFRSLLRAEQKRQSKQQLEEMLLDGMKLGEPVALTPEIWDELRHDAPAVTDEPEDSHPDATDCKGHSATCCGKHHAAAE
jgi:antitoxin ParD1/3/4